MRRGSGVSKGVKVTGTRDPSQVQYFIYILEC